METETPKKELPEHFAHTLHERVRQSSYELRKLLITFSAGGLALAFASLTAQITPALDKTQEIVLTLSVFTFGISVLGGILSWQYGSERNYYWAHQLIEIDENKRSNLKDQTNKYMIFEHGAVIILRWGFYIGVITLLLYGVLRTSFFRSLCNA